MSLEVGDLIFVRGRSLLDRGIEWAENGVYSHVALYAGNGNILEAQGGRRAGYNKLSAYAGKYDIGHVRRTSNAQRRHAIQYAKIKIGARYAWRAIVVLCFNLLLHLRLPYRQNFKEFVCSFYVEDAWEFAGKPLTTVKNPTPQDLANSPEIEIQKIV